MEVVVPTVLEEAEVVAHRGEVAEEVARILAVVVQGAVAPREEEAGRAAWSAEAGM